MAQRLLVGPAMLRWLAVGWFAIVSMSAVAFADDVEINTEIAACAQGSASACFAAAAELRQRHIASRLGRTPVALVARGNALLDEQCAAGFGDACFEQGRQLARAGGDGSAKVKRGCELGSGEACLYQASTERDPKRALELREQACAHDSALACEIVGETVEKGDPARAAELFRKACDGGAATGCVKIGDRDLAAHDSAAALADFSRACDVRVDAHATGDDLAVCDRAGGLATDGAAARALFQHACDGDYALGCVHLGERIARGDGGERDWGAGLAMVKDGCTRAHDARCAALVELQEHPPDPSCASDDQCRAYCKEQLWPACRRAVELEAGAEGADAGELLGQACDGGDAAGCRMLGDRVLSFAEALPSYRKGCALHDAASCGYVQLERARHGSSADLRAMRAACSRDRAACALFGLALVRGDRAQAAKVWTAACDAKIGVACRFLAESLTGSAEEGGAVAELILPPPTDSFGVCGCDDGPPRRTRETPAQRRREIAEERRRAAELAEQQRHQDEAWRLYASGCDAGDVRACAGTSGSGNYQEKPPGRVVELPAWE